MRGWAGATLLEVARQHQIYIPTLCHYQAILPNGTCRLCLVEIAGKGGLFPACDTPAKEGMEVMTAAPALQELRRSILAAIIRDTQHPPTCLTCPRRERCSPNMVCLRFPGVTNPHKCLFCPKDKRCELQSLAQYLGLREVGGGYQYLGLPLLPGGPLFERDYNLCIVCGRCVRVCEEVRGRSAITFTHRDSRPGVDTPLGVPLEATDCEFCGACVDACPTGALMDRLHKRERPEREVVTICPYCGVGCQLRLAVKGGRLLSSRPDPQGPTNRGQACVKGRFGIVEFIHHPQRLTTPLVRRNGHLEPASWLEALDRVASALGQYRPGQVALFCGGKVANEDHFVMQKFARAVLRTNNIDNTSRLDHAPSLVGLESALGIGAMTNPGADIAHSSLVFLIGTNITHSHPVTGLEVIRAVRSGKKLLLANPRGTELVRYSHLWLRHRPGSDATLLMGLARAILEEGLEDQPFIQEHCENFAAFRDSLKGFSPALVEAATGLPWEKIVAGARLLAKNRPAVLVYGTGLTRSAGTEGVLALVNLALLTGNVGRPGTGVYPLWGHNNAQGACDMGSLPQFLPGYQPLAEAAARRGFEQAWDMELPADPGLTITQALREAREGRLKALYVVGENLPLEETWARDCREALERVEFLVVQNIFLTETARQAQVVLPACSFAERDGTFTNSERRVQRVRKALEPVDQSRPDWWIICQLARRMGGKGFGYEHPSQIMEEIARLVPQYGGISYERLEKGGIQWPCPTPDHPGTPVLHSPAFARGKGRFHPLEYRPLAESPDRDYPFLLTVERVRFQFHTGTLTGRVPGFNQLSGGERLEVNPADAAALGLAPGERVRVSSRQGEARLRAVVTEDSPPGVVSLVSPRGETLGQLLPALGVDAPSGGPAGKAWPVRIEREG